MTSSTRPIRPARIIDIKNQASQFISLFHPKATKTETLEDTKRTSFADLRQPLTRHFRQSPPPDMQGFTGLRYGDVRVLV
jgi:hypothetical protein